MFKLNRYSEALISIARVFEHKAREIFASLFFVLILLIVASLLIYYAEHDAQPQQFRNAFSGLWWAVATLTTVGYGDIYPITPIGRVLGAMIAILGIGMVAVPTSILSAGFLEVLEKKNKEPEKKDEPASEKKYCPYCGKKLD
jgi:voltage-gated potassium channel